MIKFDESGKRFLGESTSAMEEEDDEIDKDVQCGLLCIKGPKMQVLASKKLVFALYSLVAMFCGASYAYHTGTISTMEKQYKFSNKKIGIIIGFSEITSILGSFFVPYYATAEGHYPRWIACGLLLYVTSFVMNGLPYFVYGSGRDALSNTLEYSSIFALNDTQETQFNTKMKDLCYANKTYTDECNHISDEYAGVSVILAISSMITGLAEAFIIPLSISYLDNNVKKSKMPMMLTLTSFVRMLAPLVGFSLASYCLKIYVEPNLKPLIQNDDPRWIGAWWMGWFVQAVVLLFLAPFLACFPKTLPRAAMRNRDRLEKLKLNGDINDELLEPPQENSLKDLLNTLKRLFTNKVLVCNNIASIFYVFGYIPYFKYQAKYIEVQYLFSSSTANMITGSVSLVFTAIGFLIAGVVIQVYKPKARYLAGWNVIASALSIIGLLGFAMYGCDANNNVEIVKLSSAVTSCNSECSCDYVKYMPVCGQNNLTYVSPCHAGCKEKHSRENGGFVFENCGCVNNDLNFNNYSSTYAEESSRIANILNKSAQNGPCPVDCLRPFYIFLITLSLIKFIKGSEGMANFLLGIRCVETKDKAVSIGLSSALLSLFSFLPSPIFFGYIIDKTCILWGKTCGQEGNCWLYDTVAMRHNMNFIACAFIFMGTLFDIGTFYYSKDVQIFDKEEDQEMSEREPAAPNN